MPSQDDLITFTEVSSRVDAFFFDLLDKSGNVIGSITPANDSVPSVSNNINRTVKRSLDQVKLYPEDQAAINPLSDRVRVRMTINDGVDYYLGVFIFADNSRQLFFGGEWSTSQLLDQTVILDQPLGYGPSYASGTSVYDILVENAVAEGLDYSGIDSTGTQLGSAMNWPGGTTRFAVMNDVAKIAGFHSGYFNGAGLLRYTTPSNSDSVDSRLVYEKGGTIMINSVVETDDILDAPNRYIVTSSGATDAPIVGYYDIPDAAPYSILSRGRVVAKVIDQQGVASSDEARAAAKTAYESDGRSYRWIQFSSSANPIHDTFDVLTVLGDNYREQEWQLACTPGGEHRHSVRRIW